MIAEYWDGECANLYLYDLSFGSFEPRPTGDGMQNGLKIKVSTSLKRESGHESSGVRVRYEAEEEVGLGCGNHPNLHINIL